MRLLVFLGNIGKKYEKTRHNAGFLFGEYLREKWGFDEWKDELKFFGKISTGEKQNEKYILLRPQTMMNLSGKALQAVQAFYKIPIENILLCYDDKDLPFGTVRFRESGSAGGHNGVKDCLRVLGTEQVSRLKIGIDAVERLQFADTADFVLANFNEMEVEKLADVFFEAEEKLMKKPLLIKV